MYSASRPFLNLQFTVVREDGYVVGTLLKYDFKAVIIITFILVFRRKQKEREIAIRLVIISLSQGKLIKNVI